MLSNIPCSLGHRQAAGAAASITALNAVTYVDMVARASGERDAGTIGGRVQFPMVHPGSHASPNQVQIGWFEQQVRAVVNFGW